MADARARLRARREPPPGKARRRRLLLLLAVLILYALLRCCHCEEPPPPEPGPEPAVTPVDAGVKAPPPPKKVRKKPAKRPRRKARIVPRVRPEYTNPTPAPEPWLVEFRLQVAARAPRLSRCFVGAERPGALKWTALLDARRGVVSDHQLEPILAGATLSKPLRACLLEALSQPRYHVRAEHRQPSRVSIVVEF